MICLAILLFGTATSLPAQDEPKQDEPQQQDESKEDKQQGKKEETNSEKREEKHKKGEPIPQLRAVIWHPTIDVNQLNLFYGAGGQEDAPSPDAKYKFKKEDMNGTSPKFDVEDDKGIKWRVKLGQEPRAETAATRLLFAAGYFVDEDYYIDELHVEGLPTLKRGQLFVTADGIVHGARLERKMKEIKKLGTWDWFKNPFVGTKEFNGLRIMMSLVNNWDLKTINNSIYEVNDEAEYAVSDVGATFGKTGDPLHRSKSVLKDYEDSKFIDKVSGDFVDFVMHSRPPLLAAINIPNYEKRTHMQDVTKHIPRADAKWLGERLSQLTEQQIRDCFRAGGYTQEEIDGYSAVIQNRIAALNAL
ncbi:MAG TPA: hypothetical protein VLA42_00780 [Verrucomicrobiae bacterium]|nr:hypothetical protein [Verrucomicrobiae bacterium]